MSFSVNCDPSVEAVKAQREMYTALKARKEALEEAVNKKLEELKQLCIQEGVSVMSKVNQGPDKKSPMSINDPRNLNFYYSLFKFSLKKILYIYLKDIDIKDLSFEIFILTMSSIVCRS